MTLEFGSPKDFQQAWVGIPDRTHPDYEIYDGSYEHCTHLGDFLDDYLTIGCENVFFEDRIVSLVTDDLRLLYQVNSFKRDLEKDAVTFVWSFVDEKCYPWADILPTGDDNYRWWQITKFKPDVSVGEYGLYCIEMNSKFDPDKTKYRFNRESEFEVVFARTEEMDVLKNELSRH